MAKDIYHDLVRIALEKDGWTITDDPYYLTLETTKLKVDLGAERIIAAERGIEKIAIEIKSFLKESFIYELHEALGQYLVYLAFLKKAEPNRTLYLAISEEVYTLRFEDNPDVHYLEEVYNIKIVVYDPISQSIKKWKR